MEQTKSVNKFPGFGSTLLKTGSEMWRNKNKVDINGCKFIQLASNKFCPSLNLDEVYKLLVCPHSNLVVSPYK